MILVPSYLLKQLMVNTPCLFENACVCSALVVWSTCNVGQVMSFDRVYILADLLSVYSFNQLLRE